VYNPAEFQSLEADMALLEMEFPPSFFNIMTHLPYHIVQELNMCGLVTKRWMYPMERCMKTLKNYMRNMTRPEASMVEGYIKDGCVGFVTEYLQRFDIVESQVRDADEEYSEEVLEGARKTYVMNTALRDAAHKYVLRNMSAIQPWLT
jgi:hypothetical protein